MSLITLASRTAKAALSLFYPPHCASCQEATESGVHLCGECEKTIWKICAPFCQRCSQPFEGDVTQELVCSNCTDREVHYDCAVAPYRSRGAVREFIHQFKYSEKLYLRQQLADWLAEGFEDSRIAGQKPWALVPVPLHHVRQRERGFNQAEVLARLLSKKTKVPLLNALKRIRYTTTQTRLDRADRMENLHGAFQIRQNAEVLNRHLILIDDVFTTGSTVEECSRILRKAGAASIRVLTVARG